VNLHLLEEKNNFNNPFFPFPKRPDWGSILGEMSESSTEVRIIIYENVIKYRKYLKCNSLHVSKGKGKGKAVPL